MIKNTVDVARAYYTAMAHKDVAGISQFLHPDVELISPLATLHGKEAVINASKGLMATFTSLDIKAVHGNDTEAILVIYLDCPAPIGMFKSASFLKFVNGLIARIELFYDARPLLMKKDEIFKK